MDKTFYTNLRSRPGVAEAVPLTDGSVGYVRVMNGAERASWGEVVGKNAGIAQATLLVRCLCDETGARVFTDADDDVSAVSAMDGVVLDALGKAALHINGLSDDGREEIKKNSVTPNSDSSSS